MARKEDKEKRVGRYIRITDDNSWDMIDEIAKDARYCKSFNKLINAALYFGLPALLRAVKLGEDAEWINELDDNVDVMTDKEFRGIIVRLIKEISVNVLVNKSILSSLFNAKEFEYGGKPNIALLNRGSLSTTPEYISEFEENGLKTVTGR